MSRSFSKCLTLLITPSLEEIHNQLNQQGYKLEASKLEDEEALFAIFKEVVDTGCQFPYDSSSREEFRVQFFGPTSQVYVCRSLQGQVIGGFYLKPNYSGRSGHISNAAYMIKCAHRGKGIGTLLIKASLQMARDLGFLAMQYNLVLSQNIKAIKLYERLGFGIIGTIPYAIRNLDGSFQDGHTMYRRIDSLTKGDCYD